MTNKTLSLFALCLVLCAVMLACAGGDGPNVDSTTASGDKIGVAECDNFIAKYEACINGKVPEAARAMVRSQLDAMRTSWKQAAQTPQGKAGLAQGCKQAHEQAKTSMASYGCSW